MQAIPKVAGFLHDKKLFSRAYRHHRPHRLPGFLCRGCAAWAGSARNAPERQYILFCESCFNNIRRGLRNCLEQRCRSRRTRNRTHHAKMRHAPQIASRQWIHAERRRVRMPHCRAWLRRARSRPAARHAQRIQSKEDCNERKPGNDGVSTDHDSSCGFLYLSDASRIAYVSAASYRVDRYSTDAAGGKSARTIREAFLTETGSGALHVAPHLWGQRSVPKIGVTIGTIISERGMNRHPAEGFCCPSGRPRHHA
jgi:hypothetical protein